MKNLFFLVFFTVSSSLLLQGQISDSFEDGDFSQAPTWTGQVDKFVVNEEMLQLLDENPSSSNTAYLSLFAPTSLAATTTWAFKVRMGFSPSSSNFSSVFLAAQEADLNNDQAAYFVQIGGISGSDDAVELYRQDENGSTTLLISGGVGAVGSSPAIASIRITRTATGQWSLEADYSGGENYEMEGTAQDNTYDLLSYFGVFCRYSSTRNDKFFFDDISINPLFEDSVPPSLLSVQAITADSIHLVFDEPLDAGSAQILNNYQITPDIGNPSQVVFDVNTPNEVKLILETPLQSPQTYNILITGVSDQNGNTVESISDSFNFISLLSPEVGDLLISEFMANPRNAVGLPNAEYIEIYNASQKALNLEGVGVASGGAPRLLPAQTLLPGNYLILANTNVAEELQSFGTIVGISSFPSLSNSGDAIDIILPDGSTTQSLQYDLSWYEDEEKEDGGFSLERIDFSQPVNCPGNWRASLDPNGGTPGSTNSVLGIQGEEIAPIALNAFPSTTNTIKIGFNETIGTLMELASLYTLNPSIEIISAERTGPRLDSILLNLATPLQVGLLYTLEIAQVEDCLGNFSDATQSLSIAIPEAITPGDLLINEVLFNPFSGGKDFVEIINVSEKVINLKGLDLINQQKTSGNRATQIELDLLMLPNQILALTPEVNDLTEKYPLPNDASLAEVDLPTLDADEGNISLFLDGELLDAFDYSEDLHSPLLDNERGVSLERLSTMLPTQGNDNWSSAAQSVGFATPGYANSQQINSIVSGSDIFSLENNTFSPDSDGFEDVLVLNYRTERNGFLANINVFDANGRPVTTLSQNELLASEGIITWDGSNDEGAKARIGIYILWIELFTPSGNKEVQKITCVLAGKL